MDIIEEIEAPQNRRGQIAVAVAVTGVALTAAAYFGKKAYTRFKANRPETSLPPGGDSDQSESEIMQDILLAVSEADIPPVDIDDHVNHTTVDEYKREVVGALKAEMVNTILGMTEAQLDEALMRGDDREEEPETHNIFEPVTWDWEQVKADRKGKLVYILHEDEFFQDERGYTQDTLTYYNGDHTLADPADRPIYNTTEVLGLNFLEDFGVGTNQDDVQYIRNEYLKAEYEVVNTSVSYSEAVLGLDASDIPETKRKARPDWDQE